MLVTFPLLLLVCLVKLAAAEFTCELAPKVIRNGKTTITYRSNGGFCRDWKIGPGNLSQRIMISFSKVDMNCGYGDKLQVLNEERTYLLYDQCHQQQKRANNKTVINFAFVRAKFVLMRMQTTSNRSMTATFDVVYVDTPPVLPPTAVTVAVNHRSSTSLPLRQQQQQAVAARPVQAAAAVAVVPPPVTPQRPPFAPAQTTKITKALNHVSCGPVRQEINDMFGSISTPNFRGDFVFDANCSWIIRAPMNQRVYLVFDSINVPVKTSSTSATDSSQLRLDQFGCSSNYVSIASLYRPNEDYRLCGQRRGIKLVTTYNVVLVNFVAAGLSDPAVGFSTIFRVIQQAAATAPAAAPTGSTPAAVSSAPMFSPPTTTTLPPPPLIMTSPPPPPARLNPLVTTTTPNRFVRSMECGLPFNRPLETIPAVGRIIGGEESNPHSWPWQVMITDGLIMCGATLINARWIVTAAHCTENINSGPIKAYMGMHNRLKTESGKVMRYISQVIVHPAYMGRLTQWDYDIALMKLQDPVDFTSDISPICLPPNGINLATIGTRGYVTGWGDTQGTGPAYVLRQATITVKKNRECGASSENMLCAGDKAPNLKDSCQGDSGGPFFMKSGAYYYLVGIVSWGYDCNGAGVYTKVSNFVNWINNVANSNFY